MSNRTLSSCPVFITNMEALLTTALEILHELDRDTRTAGDLAALDRAISILTIGEEACELFIDDVERGPEYRLGEADEGEAA